VNDRLQQFIESPLPGVWPHIDKGEAIAQIAARIQDPYRVKQGGQPFCGQAAIIFELVRRQPDRYVEICQNLYESGSFRGHDRQIVATERLRHGGGDVRTDRVDWMLMATLRSAANKIVPVRARSSVLVRNIGGMTKPWEIANWQRDLLGYQSLNLIYTYKRGSVLPSLDRAALDLEAGGMAAILLNSQALLEQKWMPISFPSHWVTLLDRIQIESETVSIPMYSWGRKIVLKTTPHRLQTHVWGVVTALP
jgi:hypothetical protein